MRYPTDIITDAGWGRIHRGHGLDARVLLADMQFNSDTRAEDVKVEECWLEFQSRVRWCSNHGDTCDQDGEWHAHWHAMRPGHGEPFTIAHTLRIPAAGEVNPE